MYTTNGTSPRHAISKKVDRWILTLAAVLAGYGAAQASEFEYSGDTGPGFWGETTGWESCAATSETARQTPINIRRARPNPRLKPLDLQIFDSEIALINN
jgi:carbonic anhydrase